MQQKYKMREAMIAELGLGGAKEGQQEGGAK